LQFMRGLSPASGGWGTCGRWGTVAILRAEKPWPRDRTLRPAERTGGRRWPESASEHDRASRCPSGPVWGGPERPGFPGYTGGPAGGKAAAASVNLEGQLARSARRRGRDPGSLPGRGEMAGSRWVDGPSRRAPGQHRLGVVGRRWAGGGRWGQAPARRRGRFGRRLQRVLRAVMHLRWRAVGLR